ncbi:hypothetical protein GEMRC1_008274 [Eukaryota sp. GEM-RC1]
MDAELKRLIKLSDERVRKVGSKCSLRSVASQQAQEVFYLKTAVQQKLQTPSTRFESISPDFHQSSLLQTAQSTTKLPPPPTPRAYTSTLDPCSVSSPQIPQSIRPVGSRSTSPTSSPHATNLLRKMEKLQKYKSRSKRRPSNSLFSHRSASTPPSRPSSDQNLSRIIRHSVVPPCIHSILSKSGVVPENAQSAGLSTVALTLGATSIQVDDAKELIRNHRRLITSRTFSRETSSFFDLPIIQSQIDRLSSEFYLRDKIVALGDVDHSLMDANETMTISRFRCALLEEQRRLDLVRKDASVHVRRIMHDSRRSRDESRETAVSPLMIDDVFKEIDGSSSEMQSAETRSSVGVSFMTEVVDDEPTFISEGVDYCSPSQSVTDCNDDFIDDDQAEESVHEVVVNDDDDIDSDESSNEEDSKNDDLFKTRVEHAVIKPLDSDIKEWLTKKINPDQETSLPMKMLEKSRYIEDNSELVDETKELIARDLHFYTKLVERVYQILFS